MYLATAQAAPHPPGPTARLASPGAGASGRVTSVREMTTHPDDLDFHPVRGRPLDQHAGDQAPQQCFALWVTQLRTRPQIREALAQMQQLIAQLWRQRWLIRLMGEALRRLLRLT